MTEVKVRKETFVLLPERALFWPRKSALIIADLHLGKAETFQQHGLILPSQANADDLRRLTQLIEELDATDVWFLGDLVHSVSGVSPELRFAFDQWLKRTGVRFELIVGNHDQRLSRAWPSEWAPIELIQEKKVDGFLFTHEPLGAEGGLGAEKGAGEFNWAGHVHPMFSMHFGPDRLRLPCFVISDNQGLVPAFSSLAGGYTIRKRASDRLFPVADGAVIEF